jgi:threonine/homoserine/homoserine lactone efflux protein
MTIAFFPFVGFALSQVATPGPANMAMLATGARFGFRRALPFMFGVLLGKQIIIWPIGFGLLNYAAQVAWLFFALKYISAAYIVWLAWRVANMRLKTDGDTQQPPGFLAGLWVHPLNPKAWAMIVTAFTAYVAPQATTFTATLQISLTLFGIQLLCHPIWTFFGHRIAKTIIGTPFERYLMWTLAGLTVGFVAFATVIGEI